MKLAFALLPLLIFAGIACTATANVGDLAVTPAAEAGVDASVTDAGRDPLDADANPAEIDAGCGVTFPQEGAVVDIAVEQAVPPYLGGGTLTGGTYVLVSMKVYLAGTSGTARVRETLRVRGSTTAGAFDRLTETANASGSFQNQSARGETVTWLAPSGPALFQTPECPTPDFQRTGQFSAEGDDLRVFDDQTGVLRTYRRLR